MITENGAVAIVSSEGEAIFEAIESFLKSNGGALGQNVERSTPLLGSALDSFTVLQLMMFLSEKYQFELGEEDFVEEHFGTVGALADRIAARRRA